jgi:hypothetical protein
VVKQLIAAGVTGDALVTALEQIEEDSRHVRSAGAERTARWRAKLADRASHVTHVTSLTSQDGEPPKSGPSQAELERELFRRGRQVCGKSSGGLIASLLKSRAHDVALARSVVELAATKHDPRQFVAAAISNNGNHGNGKNRSPVMAAFDDLLARADGGEVEGNHPIIDVTPSSS